MKKFIIGIVLMIVCMSFMQEDNFYVIHIKGNALNAVSNRGLRLGDPLKPTDKVVLQDANSKVVLIHAKRGRLEITPKSAGKDLTVKDQVTAVLS